MTNSGLRAAQRELEEAADRWIAEHYGSSPPRRIIGKRDKQTVGRFLQTFNEVRDGEPEPGTPEHLAWQGVMEALTGWMIRTCEHGAGGRRP